MQEKILLHYCLRMATYQRHHQPSSSGRLLYAPASSVAAKPHHSLPANLYHSLNHKSILGQPPTSHPKPLIGHPPTKENDGFRTVLSKRNQRRLKAERSQQSLDIEAKTFRICQKTTVHSIALLISEQRPSLSLAQY